MSAEQKKTGGRIKRNLPSMTEDVYDMDKIAEREAASKFSLLILLPVQGKAAGVKNQAISTSKPAEVKAVGASNGKPSLAAPDKANDLLTPLLLELINNPNPKPPTKQHSGAIATKQVLGSVAEEESPTDDGEDQDEPVDAEEDSPTDDGDQDEPDDADDEPGEEVVEPPFVDGGRPYDSAPDFALSYVGAGIKGIFIPGWVKRVAKNGNEMVFLGQLAYWFGKSETGSRKGKPRARKLLGNEGYHWVAKSHEKWAEETGLDKRQVRHVIEELTKRKLIVKLIRRFGGLKLSHLRLDTVVIKNLLKATPAPADDHAEDEEL